MVKYASLFRGFREDEREANEAWYQRELSEDEQIQRVKTTIMAAKMAYATKDRKWLHLLSNAMTQIELCPKHKQPALLKRLRSLYIKDLPTSFFESVEAG